MLGGAARFTVFLDIRAQTVITELKRPPNLYPGAKRGIVRVEGFTVY
jgi:hypothetical protein